MSPLFETRASCNLRSSSLSRPSTRFFFLAASDSSGAALIWKLFTAVACFSSRPLPRRAIAGWASLYPFGPLVGLRLRFCLLQGWGILTNFKVPVLADTLFTLLVLSECEGSREGLSRGIQTTYK